MTKELAIRTCGLTKQFDRHIAVNDVDLQIQMGEVYGLIGPNGAGKTTLIRMLARPFYHPQFYWDFRADSCGDLHANQ